jgi:demethylmenaquinone methyltransferase / 2-methoxy-6-polyprenyl-1,4-benzoquinol methylase
MTDSPDTTHFGYRDVSPAEKTRLVGEVFRSVAGKYDVMNDLMSLGVHRLWKRHFVSTLNLHPGDRVLDLAGGTGDVAALCAERVGAKGEVVLTDINPAMLHIGRDRLLDRGLVANVHATLVDASAIPFADGSFDAVTIAFGLRNVTDKARALSEMHRVLKVGGRAAILEFTPEIADPLKPLYDLYSFQVLPRLGQLIAGDSESYRYLAESIRKHPPPAELESMMKAAGFARTSARKLTGGIVAIHTGHRV